MSVRAVYEGGVLKPQEPLDLAEHSEVELLVFSRRSAAVGDDPTGWKTWESLIGSVQDGPEDGSEKHDDYLCGHPRDDRGTDRHGEMTSEEVP